MRPFRPSTMAAAATSNLSSSTWALRRLFAWLERRYGGHIPMATGTAASVILSTTPYIQTADLQRLLRHDAVALHVPAFFQADTARQLGHELALEAALGVGGNNNQSNRPRNWQISTSRGLESSDVTTLGAHVPYNVALTASASSSSKSSGSSSNIDEYFDGVQVELQSRRYRRVLNSHGTHSTSTNGATTTTTVVPQLWPLDLLRLQLDEAWPSGAGLARETNGQTRRPFGGGLPRIMHGSTTRWKRGLIHVDELGPLQPHQGLFSANIYLQIPPTESQTVSVPSRTETNGAANKVAATIATTRTTPVLQIWPMNIRTRWDWYRNALLLSCLSSPQDAPAQAQLRRALNSGSSSDSSGSSDSSSRITDNVVSHQQTIAVAPGDLVLFCVQRPHAAIGFGDATIANAGTHNTDDSVDPSLASRLATTRVSLQCFIQHAGPDKRLLIDC